jgi:hypothetical protein
MAHSARQLEHRYSSLSVPTVLVAGEQDHIVGVGRHSVGLSQDFKNARLVAVPGAGHMIHHSAPSEVKRAIESVVGPSGKASGYTFPRAEYLEGAGQSGARSIPPPGAACLTRPAGQHAEVEGWRVRPGRGRPVRSTCSPTQPGDRGKAPHRTGFDLGPSTASQIAATCR